MSLSKPADVLDSVYRCKYGEAVKLSPLTYPQWSQDLQYLLQGAGALSIALGEEVAPPASAAARHLDFTKRAGLAVSYIYNSCGTEAKAFLRGVDRTPSTMWTALADEFNTASSRAGREGLVREFNRLVYSDYSTISEYITALMSYRDILAPTDQHISDAMFISRLTSSLPSGYDITVQLLHQRGNLAISDYVTAIRQQEANLRIRGAETTNSNVAGTSGSALVTQASNSQGSQFANRGGFRSRGGFRGGSRAGFRGGQSGCFFCRAHNLKLRESARRKVIA